jgi:hypothetical protein
MRFFLTVFPLKHPVTFFSIYSSSTSSSIDSLGIAVRIAIKLIKSLTPKIKGFSGPRTTALPLNIVSNINLHASTLILASLSLSKQLS